MMDDGKQIAQLARFARVNTKSYTQYYLNIYPNPNPNPNPSKFTSK